MTIESPFVLFIGIVATFVFCVIMLLKKYRVSSCIAVVVCIFSITYLISTLLFPLTFSTNIMAPAQEIFRSLIPGVNFANSKLTMLLPDNTTTYYLVYRNMLTKHFVLDFVTTAILGASLYFLKRKYVKSILFSSLIVSFITVIKIVFFLLNISRSSIFDTIEFPIIWLGALVGTFCIKYILKNKGNEVAYKNDEYN